MQSFDEGIEEVEESDEAPERVFSEYQLDYEIPEGIDHPARLCEGAGLANVKAPAITHQLKLEWDRDSIKLSKAQLLGVFYATQANNTFFKINDINYRKGFLLGDGTGVGKTLTLVGIAVEAFKNHYVEQCLWIVPNHDLIQAAVSEVTKLSDKVNCWEFVHFKETDYSKSGIVFCTYSYISSHKNHSKLNCWLGENYSGMLILDECHFIKSAFSPVKKSATGQFIMSIQAGHPNCRVIYSSATAASEPHHLMCLQRLHFWGGGAKCQTPEDFHDEMKSMGVAGLELLSMDMKRRGVFLSRLISFSNVEVEMLPIELGTDFMEVYTKSCEIFIVLVQMMECNLDGKSGKYKRQIRSAFHADVLRYFACLMLSAKIRWISDEVINHYNADRSVVITVQHTGESGFSEDGLPYSILDQILRRVYRSLNISLGPGAIYVSPESRLKDKRFGEGEGPWKKDDYLSSEEGTGDEDEDEFDEMVAAAEGSSLHLPGFSVENMLETAHEFGGGGGDKEDEKLWKGPEGQPACKRAKIGDPNRGFLSYSLAVLENIDKYFDNREMAPQDLSWTASECCKSLTNAAAARLYYELRPFLPINPLDELTARVSDELEEEPQNCIANGTGRQFFYVNDEPDEPWKCVKTKSREDEVQEFMDKKKRIIIISDASSVGVSLHADRTRENTQQRIHIILEYPWSPDKLVQTLGRTLRSNSTTNPTYLLVKTNIPSEARFLCVIEERMKQLGAICQGQAQASVLTTHLSTNLNSAAGVRAISRTIAELSTNMKIRNLLQMVGIVQPKNNFDVTKYVCRTFNRLMMLPVNAQKTFFKHVACQVGKLAEEDSIFSNLSGVDIPSFKLDADVTSIGIMEWDLKGGSVQLRTLKVDRTLTYGMLKNKVRGKKKGQFYSTPLGLVCYVTEEGKTMRDPKTVYVPYSREAITMRLQSNYEKCEKAVGKFRWNHSIKELETKRGCRCAVKSINCRQGICYRRCGVQEIEVICGFTYSIYGEIARITELEQSKIRLARITWTKEKEKFRDVGLLLEPKVAKILKEELHRMQYRDKAYLEALEGKYASEPDMTVYKLKDANLFDEDSLDE